MKVGDYVRTDDGLIMKIKKIERNEITTDISLNDYSSNLIDRRYLEECIIKSSTNIIDLIEENDLIKIEYEISGNKKQQEIVQVIRNFQGLLYVNTFVGKFFIQDLEHYNRKILSIVTKEQFESMEYKIGK